MSRTEQQSTYLHTILHQLAGYDDIFRDKGDEERSRKVERLAEKIYRKEFILAFCGHFSAGKSTMINYLMGEEILPSSPIPTSANLVKVHQSREDYAKIHYHTGKPVYFKAPFEYTVIKEFCRNGEDVYSVEIGRSKTALPEGVSVLDTPGVDSTDDAHRISTESAIHLADAVFYVMDYNHVQSQVNFQFTKELKRHGVKLYLVVNQIDKHHDEELSFENFKEGVRESFASWGVVPDGVFYTSLKDLEDENNQAEDLRELIKKQVTEKEALIEASARSAMSQLIHEHKSWYEQQQQHVMEEGREHLSEEEWRNKDSLLFEEEKILDELNENDSSELRQDFEDERSNILKNAYLMPFETRDLAKEFLESQQADFKVGFLFSKQKTEEEKMRRAKIFKQEVNSRIETQLDWHLKSLGKALLKKNNAASPALLEGWENLSLQVDEDYLTGLIKPGARVTGDYVLQYCDNLSEDLKKNARRQSNELLESNLKHLKNSSESKQTQLLDSLQAVRQKTVYVHKWKLLEEEKLQQMEKLGQSAESNTKEDKIQKWVKQWNEKDQQYIEASEMQAADTVSDFVTLVEKEILPPGGRENNDSQVSVESAIDRLERMTHVFKNLHGFTKIAQILDGKRERLAHQTFTIALFGAFSAGKSSFANALLGKKVLPVSPNPTTASINRIKPVTELHHHETADVQIKSEEQLFQDISHSLSYFERSISNVEEALEIIPKLLDEAEGDAKEKIHLTFLAAFYKGFDEFKLCLGEKLTVSLDDYRGYVADETKSCFVESIDLYYDCDVTRKGITLVDTPGADSINARHTGVAFEYIKNADAILFVTYYNHAFAKADREFLIQLGRVKDTFELDKMFFIVNAIDLAKNDEEKNEVIEYVQSQLIHYGIRFPRIFGVSSLLALEKQEEPSTGMENFKQEFDSFIRHELVSMSVDSAINEWEKGIKRFKNYIEAASSDHWSKQHRIHELKQAKSAVKELLDARTSDNMEAEVQQELDELIYYLKQRVFFRLSDFYKEAFHSGLFMNEPNAVKALQSGLKEYITSVGFDLSQELRATSLRIQQFIGKQLQILWDELEAAIQEKEEEIMLSSPDYKFEEAIEFEQAFKDINLDRFKDAFSTFKNPKQFLEKGGKKEIQEELEKKLHDPADEYLIHEKQRLEDWNGENLKLKFMKLKEEAIAQAFEQIDSNIEALSNVQDIDKLRSELKWLEEETI
ncbi:dynamin family protein [Bacillus sp. Marseille-Q1617]|uniref:dynamin family protein n=1 Tax=Bacillus sp. Marseille-Q1617 TaxID=2736887 RepID=UPI0015888FE3|nr:dynamin family protein [Bacillus sp. Marseille-Q1617]